MDAFLAVLAVVASLLSPPHEAAAAPDTTPAALRLLHDWDQRRAAAWASGDPAALRPLYVEGSRAGRADRAALAAYADRGLRVPRLRFQVAAVEVLGRSRARLVLSVTDRLVDAAAVGAGVRWQLPADRWSTRVVVLRRVDGEWRVDAVVDQISPAASTASTSRWRKR